MRISCMGHMCLKEETIKALEAVLKQEGNMRDVIRLIESEQDEVKRASSVKFGFETFQSNLKLLKNFVINILQTFDDGHCEYAIAECLMETAQFNYYDLLLKSGLELKDIWSLWRHTQMLPQGRKYLFEAIVLRKNVCNEICCRHFITSRKFPDSYKIVISTIQAHNEDSFPALLYLLREFPLEPHNRKSFQMVFRALVLAGYRPSRDFIEKVINKSYKTVVYGNFDSFGRWYKNYSKCVPLLTHLCRLVLRRCMKRNVIHAVTKLDIPEQLQDYIALKDEATLTVIYKSNQ